MSKLKSIGVFIDESVHRYLDNFPAISKITAWYAIAVVFGIIAYFMTPTYADLPFIDNPASVFTPVATVGGILSFFNGMILSPLISLWLGIAVILAYQAKVENKEIDSQAELTNSWKYFFPVLIAGFIFAIAITFLAILPILPSLILSVLVTGSDFWGGVSGILLVVGGLISLAILAYLSVKYIFWQYAIIIKKTPILASFPSSAELSLNRFWPVAIRLLIVALVAIVVAILIDFILFGIGFALLSFFGNQPIFLERASVILDFLFSQISFMITIPLSISFMFTLYNELQSNK